MVPRFFVSVFWLFLNVLYPAFATSKAIKKKKVGELLTWGKYWTVFALFSSIESIADVLVAFWLPFYDDLKLSAMTSMVLGSSMIFDSFVFPFFLRYEKRLDQELKRIREQSSHLIKKFGGDILQSVVTFVRHTIDAMIIAATDPLPQQDGPRVDFSSDSEAEAPKPSKKPVKKLVKKVKK